MKITIIGAGISGLATAYLLAREHTVKIIAKDFTPNVTSNRAALSGSHIISATTKEEYIGVNIVMKYIKNFQEILPAG